MILAVSYLFAAFSCLRYVSFSRFESSSKSFTSDVQKITVLCGFLKIFRYLYCLRAGSAYEYRSLQKRVCMYTCFFAMSYIWVPKFGIFASIYITNWRIWSFLPPSRALNSCKNVYMNTVVLCYGMYEYRSRNSAVFFVYVWVPVFRCADDFCSLKMPTAEGSVLGLHRALLWVSMCGEGSLGFFHPRSPPHNYWRGEGAVCITFRCLKTEKRLQICPAGSWWSRTEEGRYLFLTGRKNSFTGRRKRCFCQWICLWAPVSSGAIMPCLT